MKYYKLKESYEGWYDSFPEYITKDQYNKLFNDAPEDIKSNLSYSEAEPAVWCGTKKTYDWLNSYWKKNLSESVLKESIDSTQEFVEALETEFKLMFPKSFINVVAKKTIGEYSVHINHTLGSGKSEWMNGIINNDPWHNQFFVYGFDINGGMRSKLSFEPFSAGAYTTKDPEEKHYGRSIRLTTKKQGTPDQILQHWKKYLSKTKQTMQDTIELQLALPFRIEDKI